MPAILSLKKHKLPRFFNFDAGFPGRFAPIVFSRQTDADLESNTTARSSGGRSKTAWIGLSPVLAHGRPISPVEV